MDFKVSPQSVQGQAVSKLRDAIVAGIFQPGDRLVESDLCARLGISRPSVREALRSLEAERLVVIVPNRGPMIPILTVEMARQIYDVRALLEGEAAALFAAQSSTAAVAEMRRALEAFDDAVKHGDLNEEIRATRRFYEPMLLGCGNRVIYEVLETLSARITFLRSKSMSLTGRAQKSAREMRAILKAVAAGDAEAARAAAVAHVRQACNAAVKAYSADKAPVPKS
ncbi:GntR family transcriptional regulator [uncultured Methylovirgula sp.]|uniref:GntR family transcriptional regulator n=1 Tax=uncultured Methylovirgula sp. TaxID=1285960 RepID=UPI002634324C|nr:GntR family transcriptional regulator [uncultured Methylovirgula sp.]